MNEDIVVNEINIFDEEEVHFDCCVRTTYHPETDEYDVEWSEGLLEEREGSEVYYNCRVEIWRNSITGQESVAWNKCAE